MANSLDWVYLTDRINSVPVESLAAYTYLRLKLDAWGDALSMKYCKEGHGLAVFEVHSIGSMNNMRTTMAFEGLVNAGWIRKVEYEGNVGWMLAEPIDGEWVYLLPLTPQSTADRLRSNAIATRKTRDDQVAHAEKLLAAGKHVRKREAAEANPTKAGTWLGLRFGAAYEEKYGHPFIGITSMRVDVKIHGRFQAIFELFNDLTRAEAYLDFAVENWDRIVTDWNVTGRPSPPLLATPGFMNRLVAVVEDGWPEAKSTGLGDRAGQTDWTKAKDGW